MIHKKNFQRFLTQFQIQIQDQSFPQECEHLKVGVHACNTGAGKTTAVVSISVNVLSTNFLFCVVPAGGEGGGNRKYVDVSGKC